MCSRGCDISVWPKYSEFMESFPAIHGKKSRLWKSLTGSEGKKKSKRFYSRFNTTYFDGQNGFLPFVIIFKMRVGEDRVVLTHLCGEVPPPGLGRS